MSFTTFESFGLKEPIMKALQEMGFQTPSPIQQQVIPQILAGADLVGQAHTGTGKTAAFGLPALNMIDKRPGVQMLVITPTRELATQVSEELYKLGKYSEIRTVAVYGGKSFSAQIDGIKRGAQIVVATPGRLLDLLESGRLQNFRPMLIVLDEADEMLDMGFLEDIQKIFTFLPEKRQTLLFSATMPVPIQKLAQRILNRPVFVSVTNKETTNKDIEQIYYLIHEDERDDAMIRLLQFQNPVKSIIFCRTKKDVDRLATRLVAQGELAKGLHGDMEQPQREDVIRSFRSSQLNILVATDVAARGLNVMDVSHVYNYHLPFDPASYVHRIGRTGRAGNKGLACTLITPREYRDFQRYSQAIGKQIRHEEVPTLIDLKNLQRLRLVEEIKKQPIHADVDPLMKILSAMDPIEVSKKLVSLLLSRQFTEGPDQIGVDMKRLEQLSTNNKPKSAARRGFEKRRKPMYNSRPKR